VQFDPRLIGQAGTGASDPSVGDNPTQGCERIDNWERVRDPWGVKNTVLQKRERGQGETRKKAGRGQ